MLKVRERPAWVETAKLLMLRHGITQRMIAVKIGVHENYVSMIFLGDRMPKMGEERVMTAIKELIAARKE